MCRNLFLVLLLTLASCSGPGLETSPRRRGADRTEPAGEKPVAAISAIYLFDDYVRNPAAAVQKYNGKLVEIDGSIITMSIMPHESFVNLKADSTAQWQIRCFFDSKEGLGSYRNGDTITVRGICEGKEFDYVNMKKCTVVPKKFR